LKVTDNKYGRLS